MSKRFETAILGGDSPVAEALFELLVERRFPLGEVSALVLEPDDERTVSFAGRPLLLDDARSFDFGQVQLVFLAEADPELIAQAERAADAGAVVIDAIGCDWRDSAIPLVVADVNPRALARFNERNIVGMPDPLVVALAPIVACLDGAFGVRRLSLTGLLPASDGGRAALEDLARETTALLNARFYERRFYPRQIAFNVLPQDADAGVDGRTERERRIADELQSHLAAPVAAYVNLLRVPVFYGFGAALELDLAEAPELHAVSEKLAALKAVELVAAGEAEAAPTPVTDAAMTEVVSIGRLRRSGETGLSLWLTADNNRRCSALNAVLNAEILSRDYL